MRRTVLLGLAILGCFTPGLSAFGPEAPPEPRPRIRDLGISPGVLAPGPLNAITDVDGVRVGHRTLVDGDDVRTGVTAIVPHGGNLFAEKVPALRCARPRSPSASARRRRWRST